MKLVQMHRKILSRYTWYWDGRGNKVPRAYPVASIKDQVRLEAWYKWRYRHG